MHDGELTDDDTTISDANSETASNADTNTSASGDSVAKLPLPANEILKICAVVGSPATKQRYIYYIYIYIRLLIVYMSIGMYIYLYICMHIHTTNRTLWRKFIQGMCRDYFDANKLASEVRVQLQPLTFYSSRSSSRSLYKLICLHFAYNYIYALSRSVRIYIIIYIYIYIYNNFTKSYIHIYIYVCI